MLSLNLGPLEGKMSLCKALKSAGPPHRCRAAIMLCYRKPTSTSDFIPEWLGNYRRDAAVGLMVSKLGCGLKHIMESRRSRSIRSKCSGEEYSV